MGDSRYTTQLAAGLGMIPETMELLRLYATDSSPAKFADRVVGEGIFSTATARRARNIVVEMFAPRFLRDSGEVAQRLQYLLSHGFSYDALSQIFFLQTARAQRIFADFVVEVYWPRYVAGVTRLSRDDAFDFVCRALDNGMMAKRWSESTIARVSGYLVSCCADFGLLDEGRGNARSIRHFSLRRDAALYLVHDLHFSGLSDMNIVQHRDWALFGLEPPDVIQLVSGIGNDGHLVVQSSGTVIQISWKYKTMEGCLDALIKR